MNLRLPKRIKVNILLATLFTFILHTEAKSQNNPQITCPEKRVVNICAPVGIPVAYTLEDFSPSDDNTPVAEIDFRVDQTVDKHPDFTIVNHLYTFTDKDGNSSNCEVTYNVLNRFLQAPEIQEQRPICQGDLFPGVKLGAKNYRIYADNDGHHGELIGLCDNPGPLCVASKLGIDGSTVVTNQVWISHFVTFPDGSICESTLSPLQIDVLEKPEATLSTSTIFISPGDVITLMDLVDENTTGYWTGSNISSFATADGKTEWVFSAIEIGLTKLFYTVESGPCSQSYTLVVETYPPSEPEPYDYFPIGPIGPSGATGASGDYSGGYSGFPSGPSGSSSPSSGGTGIPGSLDEPQPDAGLVTAAEWSDLDNWDFLDSLLNENEYYEMPEYWEFYPQYRVSVFVKNTDDLPVIDANVELSYDGEVQWVAKTDNKGKAELWPSLYQNDTLDVSNLSLIVNDEAIRGVVLLHEEGINEVTINGRPINLRCLYFYRFLP